jgi:S1-C subfamily serine protease
MDRRHSGLELAVAKISRVQGPRRVLQQLRELIIRNHRAMLKRAVTTEEYEWCGRVHALLTSLVQEGDRVLPPAPQPRKITHRARKRPSVPALFLMTLVLYMHAGYASAQDWTATAAHLEDSIVRIVTVSKDNAVSLCTGVIVNADAGYVAVAAHCFSKDPTGSSIAVNNHHAERVKVNHVLDVAVVQAKGLSGSQAHLRHAPAPVGLPVAFVGYGFGALKPKMTFGWLSDEGDDALLEARVLLDAEAIAGMSGGGIFDQAGELVSLVEGQVRPVGPGRLSYGPRPHVLADFLKPYLPKQRP